MKTPTLLPLAFLGLQASLSTQASIPHDVSTTTTGYPTRKIGSYTVVDTQLVREAAAYARAHSSEFVWNHIMRGWLYGTLILAHNSTLLSTVDPETHAVAALLHDLGWDETPNSPVVSKDRRFEVDGAIAAREFIQAYTTPSTFSSTNSSHIHSPSNSSSTNGKNGNENEHGNESEWDTHRIQLVWDSIALHTQSSIFTYKEDVVRVTGSGILMDFEGPSDGVTRDEYDGVIGFFPKDGFREGVNATFVWLCGEKAGTTYDTFMQVWGDAYVPGYSAVGNRVFDIIAETSDTPI